MKKNNCIFFEFCFWEDISHPVNWSTTHSTGPQTLFFLHVGWVQHQSRPTTTVRGNCYCFFHPRHLLSRKYHPEFFVPKLFLGLSLCYGSHKRGRVGQHGNGKCTISSIINKTFYKHETWTTTLWGSNFGFAELLFFIFGHFISIKPWLCTSMELQRDTSHVLRTFTRIHFKTHGS